MVATPYYGAIYRGTNADRTGGTWTNLAAGWIFIETDTGLSYYWTGSAWNQIFSPSVPFTFAGANAAQSTYVLRYYPMYGAFNNPSATEAGVQTTFPLNILLKRLLVKFTTNGLNAATTVAFRDDGANATSVSVAAAGTTEVDSGAISVVVAAGSKIDWLLDTSTSISGTWLVGWIYAIGVTY